MKVRLGYIATPLTLDSITYAHTITYTHYQKIEASKQHQALDKLLRTNLTIFQQVLYYNYCNEVFFYRFSHNLVPLATHPCVQFDYINPYLSIWQQLGQMIKDYQIRMDSHPDQFCVLNSLNPKVISATREHLLFHYRLFQAMKIPAKVVLHVGSSKPDKKQAKLNFIKQFQKLPIDLQKMIMLENDDKIFTMEDILELAQTLHIPMVFDYHHYLCNHQQLLTKDILIAIFNTWDKEIYPPKVHFSSPKSKKEPRAHSEYINEKSFLQFLRILKEVDHDVDIMLECKGRDLALFKLARQLKCHEQIRFLNETTFIF